MTCLDTTGDDDSGAEYNALMAQPKSTLVEMVIAQHTEIAALQIELTTLKNSEAPMSETVKTATEVSATQFSVKCPHCGEENDDWLIDPRRTEGTVFECEFCPGKFTVSESAELRTKS